MHCFSGRTLRGLILVIVGLLLLFHSLGLFHAWLNLLFVIGSILIVAYGSLMANLPQQIMKLFNKKQ